MNCTTQTLNQKLQFNSKEGREDTYNFISLRMRYSLDNKMKSKGGRGLNSENDRGIFIGQILPSISALIPIGNTKNYLYDV